MAHKDNDRKATRERFERVLAAKGWRSYFSDTWGKANAAESWELDDIGLFFWRHGERVAGLAWDCLSMGQVLDNSKVVFLNPKGFVVNL